MAKRSKIRVAKRLTKSIIVGLRRKGYSVGRIANRFRTTRVTLYRRFSTTLRQTVQIARDARSSK